MLSNEFGAEKIPLNVLISFFFCITLVRRLGLGFFASDQVLPFLSDFKQVTMTSEQFAEALWENGKNRLQLQRHKFRCLEIFRARAYGDQRLSLSR